MKTKVLFFVLASAFLAMLVMGCEGTVGPKGDTGAAGSGGGGAVSSNFFGDWTSGSVNSLEIGNGFISTTVDNALGLGSKGVYTIASSTADTITMDSGTKLKFDTALLAKGILRLLEKDGVDVVEVGSDSAGTITAMKLNVYTRDNKVDAKVIAAVTTSWSVAGVAVTTASTKSIVIETDKITTDVGAAANAEVEYNLIAPIVKNGAELTAFVTATATPFAATTITITLGTSTLIGKNAVTSYKIGAVTAVAGTYLPLITERINLTDVVYVDMDGVEIQLEAQAGATATNKGSTIKVGATEYFVRKGAIATTSTLDTGDTMAIVAGATTLASDHGVTAASYATYSFNGAEGGAGNLGDYVAKKDTMNAPTATIAGKYYTNGTVIANASIIKADTGIGTFLVVGNNYIGINFGDDVIKLKGATGSALNKAAMNNANAVLTLISPITGTTTGLEVLGKNSLGAVYGLKLVIDGADGALKITDVTIKNAAAVGSKTTATIAAAAEQLTVTAYPAS